MNFRIFSSKPLDNYQTVSYNRDVNPNQGDKEAKRMNTSELRAERIRQNKSVEYMAGVIGKTNDTYAKKERGLVKFSPEEMVVISNDLCLTPAMFNAIFFDSQLLFSKFRRSSSPEL